MDIFNDKKPIALAPLAGVSDVCFRQLCEEFGADMAYTEMVSAKAITYKNRNTNKDNTKSEQKSTGIEHRRRMEQMRLII